MIVQELSEPKRREREQVGQRLIKEKNTDTKDQKQEINQLPLPSRGSPLTLGLHVVTMEIKKI